MKRLFVLLTGITLAWQVKAQDLPRKVFIGIRMERITDDARRIMGLDVPGGVLISEVFPNSTALAAGFKKGDILLSIDGKQASEPADVIAMLKGRKTGEQFSYELRRAKKRITGKGTFSSMPEERYAGLQMEYASVSTQTGRQRMIISKPANSTRKLPAILFIGGIGCYSLDFPFDSTQSEVQLLNALSRGGYICVRAEKPGVGDNYATTKPCNEVSFMEETRGYADMIDNLKRRNDVDSSSIYIIGHSMGGVFAPLVAERTRVKGVVAYGTIGSNFLEYLMKTRRTIGIAEGMTPQETDELVKDACECTVYYFAEKLSSEQAEQKQKGCGELVSIFDLRSRAYNDELYALNIPGLWSRYMGKALLLWGSADYISAADDHRLIAEAVNTYHPGNARMDTVLHADHGMLSAVDFRAAKSNPGMYNPAVGEIILKWLRQA